MNNILVCWAIILNNLNTERKYMFGYARSKDVRKIITTYVKYQYSVGICNMRLIGVDVHSEWPEVSSMDQTTSSKLIYKLRVVWQTRNCV